METSVLFKQINMKFTKSLARTWKPSYYIRDTNSNVWSRDCCVPTLLGITLWVSRALGAAPVRLTRAGACWRLGASPRLAWFQRLTITLSSILLLTGLGFDFVTKNHTRVGTKMLTSAIWIADMGLTILTCLARAASAPVATENLITLLKEIKQINFRLNFSTSSSRTERTWKSLLIGYFAWVLVTNVVDCFWFSYNSQNNLVNGFYSVFYYQSLLVVLMQLQYSLSVVELNTALTALNRQLKSLIRNDLASPKLEYLTIRHLAQNYETICNLISQINKDYGIVLLLTFTLGFIHFLTTPYHLISGIVLSHLTHQDFLVLQSNWCVLHFCKLLVLVEPCHWVQDQVEQTRGLLGRLASRVRQSGDRVSRELELFSLQAQLRNPELAPLGVFIISRSLVTSIVSIVSTYLVILVQMQKITEIS